MSGERVVVTRPTDTPIEDREDAARIGSIAVLDALELYRALMAKHKLYCSWCYGDGFVGVVPCRECGSTGRE